MKPPSLTLGIEEEYQIIDPATRELKSYITEILNGDQMLLGEIKPELHQSMVEIGTRVCRTPAEVRAELVRLRGHVMQLAARNGLVIAAAGTHPFSSWLTQEITPLERYMGVRQDLADLAQQLLIFGTHVHIGIEDPDFLIDAMNVARYFVPHVLTLSTSSPFWMGRDTGLKSYRSIIFRNFPRTGIPRSSTPAPPTPPLWTRWCGRAASRTAPRSGGTSGPITATRRLSSGCVTCARGSTRRSAWPRSCKPSSPSCGSCGATT